jgi:hypothetical protein
MRKPTSSTQLAVFLFVDSRWHEPQDAVQCRTHGSTFEFLFEFQTEFFVRVLSCSRIKTFNFRESTVFLILNLIITNLECVQQIILYMVLT